MALFARELRLVFTVLFVLFVTSETWQLFGRLSGVRYAVLFGLLVAAAGVLGALNARHQARAVAGDPLFQAPGTGRGPRNARSQAAGARVV